MKKRIVLLILPNIFLILLFFSIVNHFVKSKNELKQIQQESGKYGNLVDVGNSKINVYVNDNLIGYRYLYLEKRSVRDNKSIFSRLIDILKRIGNND